MTVSKDATSLTVEEARDKRVCRICKQPIICASGPAGWEFEFGKRSFPKPTIILDFGKEFAHEDCLIKEKNTEKI